MSNGIATQMEFTPQQIDVLVKKLKDAGLWDPQLNNGKGGVTNTLANPAFNSAAPPVGIWKDIYNYIYSVIRNDPRVDEGTKMWFSAAGSINNDETSVPADAFIRGATQYGLEFAHKVDGLSQDQINAAIQKTSNLIGQGVVGEILAAGGLPVFGKMLTNDISAAIGNGQDPGQTAEMAAAGLIRQDVGGWGGTFYFWNESINYGSGQPSISVGDATLNGAPSLNISAPSYDEFIYADASATADATMANDKLVRVDPMQALKNTWESITAGVKAQAPASVRAKMFVVANLIVLGRTTLYNNWTGPHSPQDFSSSQKLSLADGMMTVSYNGGDAFTVNLDSVGGPSMSWSDWDGANGTVTSNTGSNGAVSYQGNWTNLDGQASQGQTTYNADGSSTGKVTYASGAYALITDDGRGDVSTTYYTQAGHYVSSSWVHADGSSGVEAMANNGLTRESGASSFRDVPVAGYELLVNPDGSYRTVVVDPNDVATSTSYDVQGNASAPSANQGSGINWNLSNNTTQTSSTATGSVTNNYDAAGHLTHDSWSDTASGTSGYDTYNASGLVIGKRLNSDGSSDTFTLAATPGGASATFLASPEVTVTEPGPFDLTKDHFAVDGTLASDTWSLGDGAQGQDSFNSDGSGTGTAIHSDGTHSAVVLDAQGNITTENQDASGNRTSQDWWHADGTHGIVLYSNGLKTAQYTYTPKGQVTVEQYDANGNVVEENTEAAGAVLNPDNTGFGRVSNTDGSTGVYYNDAYGNFSVFQYGQSGQFQGTGHFSTDRNPSSGPGYGTLSDGTTYTNTAIHDSATAQYVDSNGTQWTQYFNNAGQTTGDTWIKTDGSHGTDTFNADGSSVADLYTADGSSTYVTDNGQGNHTNTYYDAGDSKTGDAWLSADGSRGSDTYAADGSSSGRTYAADGSAVAYVDDGQGDSTTSEYNAGGALLESDQFKANGSSSGTTYYADGRYTNRLNDGQGDVTQTDFSSAGSLIDDAWTQADGSHGTDAFDANRSRISTAINADGTSAITTTELGGNMTAEVYSGADVLIRDYWSKTDGTSGDDTFASNGAITEATTVAVDGSKAVKVDDGLGDITTTQYDAGGSRASDVWQKSDGTHGIHQQINGGWTGTSYATDGTSINTALDALGNSTTTQYDSSGAQTGSSWTNSDGTHGATTFAPDGSSTTASYNRDGSHSQTTIDASGNTLTNYYSIDGVLTRDTWHHTDGTTGHDNLSATPGDANANFRKEGVYAVNAPSSDGAENIIKVYDGSGNFIYSIEEYQPDSSGGYGGPVDDTPDVTFIGTQQTTVGMGGANQLQHLNLNYGSGQVNLDEGLADGSDLNQLWAGLDMTTLLGQQTIVSRSTFGTTAVSAGAAPQNFDVIRPDASGLTIQTRSGAILHYGGSQNAIDLSGDSAPGTILNVYPAGGIGGAANYVRRGATTDTLYSAGGTDRTTVVDGVVTSDVWSNGHGASGSYVDTYPAGGSPTQWGGTQTQSTRNSTGYTLTDVSTQGARSYVYRNPDGTIAKTDDVASNGDESVVMHDPSGNTTSSSFVRGGSDNGDGDLFRNISTDQNGDVITTVYSYHWTGKYSDETATSSWTTADGTQLLTTFDLSTGAGTQQINYADGTWTSVVSDAQGGYIAQNHDVDGHLVGDQVRDHSGQTSAHTYNADGSYSIHTDDGQGYVVDTNYSSAGLALTDTWTESSDGSYGSDTYNPDGSSSGTWADPRGNHGEATFGTDGQMLTANDFDSNDSYQFNTGAQVILTGSGNSVALLGNNTLSITGLNNVVTATDSTVRFNGDGSGDQVLGSNNTANYFDDSGKQTRSESFDANGKLATHTNFVNGVKVDTESYNASGTQTANVLFDASGVQTDNMVLDGSGQVTQDQQFNGGQIVDAINFTSGAETDEVFYGASQKKTADATFDSSGQEIAYTSYDASGQVNQVQKFSDGYVSEVTNYSNGVKSDVASYDASGHKTADAIFNASGIQTDYVLFDANGQVLQDQQFSNGYVVDAINYSLGVATDEAFFNAAGQQTGDTVFTTSSPGPAAISTSVNQLIQAMASFAPPAAVHSNMTAANGQQVHTTILAVSH